MAKLYLQVVAWLMMSILLEGCGWRQQSPSMAEDANVRLAVVYLQQKNHEKARMALNQALTLAPNSVAGWGAMGYLEELSGNQSAAAAAYRRAIALAPNAGEGHNNYGAFLCRQGQPAAGIQEFLIAAQQPSYITRAAAYENAGRCALTISDQAAADKYFQAAMKNR